MTDVRLFVSQLQTRIDEWKLREMSKHPPKQFMVNFWIKEILLENCVFFSIDKKMAEVYIFSEKGYKKMTLNQFGRMIQSIYIQIGRMDYRRSCSKEIHDQVYEMNLIRDEQVKNINNYPNLIPLLDGLYDLTTWERKDYDPRYYYTSKLSVVYTEDTECPEFRKFINRILPNGKKQMQIFCFLCYCMTPSIRLQISQIWVGSGKNGKTELSVLLDLILGDLVSHVTMDMFMKGNQFMNSELAQKWVNVGSELTPSNFRDTGVQELKRNATNRHLRSEAKFDSPVNFLNKCKHIYDINNTPPTNTSTDYAFFRRFQLIEFTEHISKEERELEIMDRIFAQEGAQIVQYLLSFHDQLEQWIIEDAEEAEEIWLWNRKSTDVFFDNYCTLGGPCLVTEAYDQYSLFCKHNLKRAVSKHHFGRLMGYKKVVRSRMVEDEAMELIGYYDYKNRPWVYNITINYDEVADLERRNRQLLERKDFLNIQEKT